MSAAHILCTRGHRFDHAACRVLGAHTSLGAHAAAIIRSFSDSVLHPPLFADDDGDGEGDEGEGEKKRRKKKKKRKADMRLDDEDYDLLEEQGVMVSRAWATGAGRRAAERDRSSSDRLPDLCPPQQPEAVGVATARQLGGVM